MLKVYGLIRLKNVDQFFIQRDEHGSNCLWRKSRMTSSLPAPPEALERFTSALSERFTLKVYLGQAVLPHACFFASKMQQRIDDLTVAHLLDANAMLSELKR